RDRRRKELARTPRPRRPPREHVGVVDLEIEARTEPRLGVAASGKADRTVRRCVERTGGELALDRDVALERALRGQRQLCRPLVDGDVAVEPDELAQGTPVVGLDAPAQTDLGCPE